MRNLRAVAKDRIEGILVPFNVIDKYGNWWDRATDFELDLFEKRPVFWWHRKAQVWERAGYLDDATFQMTDEGLLVQAVLEDNEAAGFIMAHVRANDAAWSSGTMPHWWEERADGYVVRWPIVEGSVATALGVVSPPASTTVRHVRAFVEEQEVDESLSLARSMFVMPLRNGNGQEREQERDWREAVQWSETVSEQLETVTEELGELRSQVTELQERPERKLPDREEKEHERAADIQVMSKWDRVSLFGLALFHECIRSSGRRHTEMDESFYRALMHKVEQAHGWQVDEIERVGELRSMPWIDEAAYQAVHKRVPHLRADEAMGSTLANLGDELVPTVLASVFWREVFLATDVAKHLMIVDMPSQPWDYPTIGSGPTVRLVSEITDQTNFTVSNSIIPTSQIATDKITFSAGKIGALTIFSEELYEDSVNIDVLRAFGESFMIAMAQAWDEILLSGDESATVTNISHYGTDPTGTAYDKILAVDGLRHMAVGASDSVAHTAIGADSGITLQKLMGARGRLGLKPKDLVMFVDPGVYYKFLALDAFESLADLGPQATLLTGMVGAVKGVPIVVTDQLENTNASGQIEDSHDATKGSFLVVNRRGVIVGKRRDIQIDNTVVPGADGRAIWGTMRFDVQQMEAGHVAYGYNTTV